ncbi:MAG: riboflavin biosynthesis protein RibF [Phycisphaeraceae bacterium]
MIEPRQAIVTVGNFDGVHRGHRALLAAARERAQALNADVVVLTFTEHPARVLRPSHAPTPLMTPGERAAALMQAGADRVEWLKPSPEILQLSPANFIDYVQQRVDVAGWLEGPDFRFGKGRAGDVDTLRELGDANGFDVEVIQPIEVVLTDRTIVPVRSSLVRWLVEMGRVTDAALCLGQPLSIRGEVQAGEKRGRQIGFPTANLDTGDRLLPADGVYGGLTTIDNQTYPVAVSVGTKPTFAGGDRAFEAYILDFEGDLYNRSIGVELVRWVREQYTFPNVDALVAQMHRDVNRIRRWHQRGFLKITPHAAA